MFLKRSDSLLSSQYSKTVTRIPVMLIPCQLFLRTFLLEAFFEMYLECEKVPGKLVVLGDGVKLAVGL